MDKRTKGIVKEIRDSLPEGSRYLLGELLAVLLSARRSKRQQLRLALRRLSKLYDLRSRKPKGWLNKKAHNHFRNINRKDMDEEELRKVRAWMLAQIGQQTLKKDKHAH